ncbi:MAG: tRNA (guanosine(46)-N7)-methyltransferase TrmB [Myxococcales bacterium]|jgi:tRNA (guanine-N7-)-methyltransferase|nr:tRNA (guanosine(46)-N7)-methyltransferase TrmB [Myxococcales bacterium]
MSWERLRDGAAIWREIFENDAVVEIEIGSGDGTFLAAWAARHPNRNLLGIERSPSKARRLAERLAAWRFANVRVLQADARCLVASIIPAASVAAYHVYFPDPWPKRVHASRRIFTSEFVRGLAVTLVAGGRLHFATDVATYADVACRHVLASAAFREIAVAEAMESHPGLTTSFARKYQAGGRALSSFIFERLPVIADDQADPAASKIKSM